MHYFIIKLIYLWGKRAHLFLELDIMWQKTHLECLVSSGIPGCGGLLTADRGEFSAPTVSETYEHNLHCEWVIRVPNEEVVQLNFTEFHLEQHHACRYDYLEVCVCSVWKQCLEKCRRVWGKNKRATGGPKLQYWGKHSIKSVQRLRGMLEARTLYTPRNGLVDVEQNNLMWNWIRNIWRDGTACEKWGL